MKRISQAQGLIGLILVLGVAFFVIREAADRFGEDNAFGKAEILGRVRMGRAHLVADFNRYETEPKELLRRLDRIERAVLDETRLMAARQLHEALAERLDRIEVEIARLDEQKASPARRQALRELRKRLDG